LIAECSHINSQAGEAGEDDERERDADDHLAGLFIHFHSDLHLEELKHVRDGLLSKRERRETRRNARQGRRAFREKLLLKFVWPTLLPDDQIFNDFVGKTKRTCAPCVMGEKGGTKVQECKSRCGIEAGRWRVMGELFSVPGVEPEWIRAKTDPSTSLRMSNRGALCVLAGVLNWRHLVRSEAVLCDMRGR